MLRVFGLVGLLLVLAGCEGFMAPRYDDPVDTISIKYDPYNYDMVSVQKSADAACAAKNAPVAVQTGTSINNEEVRWAYMTFNCYEEIPPRRFRG